MTKPSLELAAYCKGRKDEREQAKREEGARKNGWMRTIYYIISSVFFGGVCLEGVITENLLLGVAGILGVTIFLGEIGKSIELPKRNS